MLEGHTCFWKQNTMQNIGGMMLEWWLHYTPEAIGSSYKVLIRQKKKKSATVDMGYGEKNGGR